MSHIARRLALLPALCLAAACAGTPPAQRLDDATRAAIADSIAGLLRATYTFDSGEVVPRFMRLYADSGRVISAASGGFTSARDSIRGALSKFWEGAGQYMQNPAWTWGPMVIDVLSPDAAVVTAQYTIPHWTPDGNPHVIGGAWTSVWSRTSGRWAIVQEHLSDLPRPVAARLEAAMPRRDSSPQR